MINLLTLSCRTAKFSNPSSKEMYGSSRENVLFELGTEHQDYFIPKDFLRISLVGHPQVLKAVNRICGNPSKSRKMICCFRERVQK